MNRAARTHLLAALTPRPIVMSATLDRERGGAPADSIGALVRPPIALDVGHRVIGVTGPPAGSASPNYEAWWDEHCEPARPWWRSPMRETSYPNGNSSASGYCVAVTPFGRSVVEYSSINGRLYLAPFRPTMSGWGEHAVYSASVEHDAPILTADWRTATLTRHDVCPCWRYAARRTEIAA